MQEHQAACVTSSNHLLPTKQPHAARSRISELARPGNAEAEQFASLGALLLRKKTSGATCKRAVRSSASLPTLPRHWPDSSLQDYEARLAVLHEQMDAQLQRHAGLWEAGLYELGLGSEVAAPAGAQTRASPARARVAIREAYSLPNASPYGSAAPLTRRRQAPREADIGNLTQRQQPTQQPRRARLGLEVCASKAQLDLTKRLRHAGALARDVSDAAAEDRRVPPGAKAAASEGKMDRKTRRAILAALGEADGPSAAEEATGVVDEGSLKGRVRNRIIATRRREASVAEALSLLRGWLKREGCDALALFKRWDTAGSTRLSRRELQRGLASVGLRIPLSNVTLMIDHLAVGYTLRCEEFTQWLEVEPGEELHRDRHRDLLVLHS